MTVGNATNPMEELGVSHHVVHVDRVVVLYFTNGVALRAVARRGDDDSEYT